MSNVWSRGSEWHRWDVHIHTPGTALANRYPANSWDDYVDAIRTAAPSVVALGVTDYLGIDGYVELRRRQINGDIPGVRLLFPNVEFRLSVHTEKARGVNFHLLFSPDEPDHVDRIRAKLRLLTFKFRGEEYACARDDLMRLGSAHNPAHRDDQARYAEGVEQFKVDFSRLQEWYADEWLKKNCLVAVAAATGDGTSGLQKDGAFSALRKDIERFAHVIFSAKPADRAFWQGAGSLGLDALRREYDGPKPCLHGSDAHGLEDVLKPKEGKLCWIKAEATFEGLRQVMLEPVERVHIGPDRPTRSQQNWIRSITVKGSPWFPDGSLELNEGLVTIIGPRGSGKTALADLIAHGADAFDGGPASFLKKASKIVAGAEVVLHWANRDAPQVRKAGIEPTEGPSLRYLSQHFVEQLCSGDGTSERLIEEIENVIFDALDETDRAEASSFAELRQVVMEESVRRVDELRVEIAECSKEIAQLQTAKAGLSGQRDRLVNIDGELSELAKALEGLIVKGKEEKTKALGKLQDEAAAIERIIANLKTKERRLDELKRAFVRKQRENAEQHEAHKVELRQLGIGEGELEAFETVLRGDVFGILSRRLDALHTEIAIGTEGMTPPTAATRSLVAVRAEVEAMQKEIGGDALKERQLLTLEKKRRAKQQERDKLDAEIKRIEGAGLKVTAGRRIARYLDVFEELDRERDALGNLYAPLADRLANSSPERQKLEFHVRQLADVEGWAARGEALLDLRKKSELQDRGSLARKAEELLGESWRKGDRAGIERGMAVLLELFKDARQLLVPTATLANFADWLFSTDHLRVTYGIRYEGTDIERLSPGTRGIVLLILYLALDEADDRPLLVDQPEENLDPQSVFEVLSGYFREARARRQVIVVTHNPNLVVNTDADQVIVAKSERLPNEQLPRLSYEGGALEDPETRRRVCQILEGGERAFRQRERRYALPQ